MSFAAVAGCGQPAGPALTAAPSDPARREPDLSAGPSTSETGERDPRDDATTHGSEHPAPRDGSEPADATARGAGAAGDDRRRGAPASEGPEASPGASERTPRASTPPSGGEPAADVALDDRERTVLALLTIARDGAGAPHLQVDADLVAGARERACTMARGATPLLAADDTENIGLVVEPDPAAAANAMHDWWMQSSDARGIRLDAGFGRYGVGACAADDRIYYSERFAP